MHGEVLLVRSAERRFSCRCRVGSWGWGGGLDWGFRLGLWGCIWIYWVFVFVEFSAFGFRVFVWFGGLRRGGGSRARQMVVKRPYYRRTKTFETSVSMGFLGLGSIVSYVSMFQDMECGVSLASYVRCLLCLEPKLSSNSLSKKGPKSW